MGNSVGGQVVSSDDTGTVDSDDSVGNTGNDVDAINSANLLTVLDLVGKHLSSMDVVSQDCVQILHVVRVEDVVEDVRSQCIECTVLRGKDGEWTSSFKSGNKSSSNDCLNKSSELWDALCELNEVHGLGH